MAVDLDAVPGYMREEKKKLIIGKRDFYGGRGYHNESRRGKGQSNARTR